MGWNLSTVWTDIPDQHLDLNTIKGQISVLTIVFQRPVALHLLIRACVQVVAHLMPPVQSPMTIRFAGLFKGPLLNLLEISLCLLYLLNVVFLFVITPLDKGLSWLPYLVKNLFLILISMRPLSTKTLIIHLCPILVHPKDKFLDNVRAVPVYLLASSSVRQIDSFSSFQMVSFD